MNTSSQFLSCQLCGISGPQVTEKMIGFDPKLNKQHKASVCPKCLIPPQLAVCWIIVGISGLAMVFLVYCWASHVNNAGLGAFFSFMTFLVSAFYSSLLSPSYRLVAVKRIATWQGRLILVKRAFTMLYVFLVACALFPAVQSSGGYQVVTYRLGREISRRAANEFDMFNLFHWIMAGVVLYAFWIAVSSFFKAIAIVPSSELDQLSRGGVDKSNLDRWVCKPQTVVKILALAIGISNVFVLLISVIPQANLPEVFSDRSSVIRGALSAFSIPPLGLNLFYRNFDPEFFKSFLVVWCLTIIVGAIFLWRLNRFAFLGLQGLMVFNLVTYLLYILVSLERIWGSFPAWLFCSPDVIGMVAAVYFFLKPQVGKIFIVNTDKPDASQKISAGTQ